MPSVIQCAANFSEGRDDQTIESILAAARCTPGAQIADCSADPDHHRMVLTLVGPGDAVVEAVFAAAAVAVSRIDLNRHTGEHPRLGAVDVVPFVPLGETPMDACVRAAEMFGERVGRELAVPVYLYEHAARRPDRRSLPQVRGRGFEAIRDRELTEELAPDFGPPRAHPSAGAVAVGARGRLLAFNVNLATDDLEIARAIARAIRERDGGPVGVRALGMCLATRGQVQVSINITEPDRVPLYRVFALVQTEARRWGVGITGTELIGGLLLRDLFETTRYALGMHDLQVRQILEPWIDRSR